MDQIRGIKKPRKRTRRVVRTCPSAALEKNFNKLKENGQGRLEGYFGGLTYRKKDEGTNSTKEKKRRGEPIVTSGGWEPKGEEGS